MLARGALRAPLRTSLVIASSSSSTLPPGLEDPRCDSRGVWRAEELGACRRKPDFCSIIAAIALAPSKISPSSPVTLGLTSCSTAAPSVSEPSHDPLPSGAEPWRSGQGLSPGARAFGTVWWCGGSSAPVRSDPQRYAATGAAMQWDQAFESPSILCGRRSIWLGPSRPPR